MRPSPGNCSPLFPRHQRPVCSTSDLMFLRRGGTPSLSSWCASVFYRSVVSYSFDFLNHMCQAPYQRLGPLDQLRQHPCLHAVMNLKGRTSGRKEKGIPRARTQEIVGHPKAKVGPRFWEGPDYGDWRTKKNWIFPLLRFVRYVWLWAGK